MNTTQTIPTDVMLSKVPEVTIWFWVIKLLSTTVGETFADFLTVNAGLGQFTTCGAMGVLLAIALVAQFRARQCVPWIYWLCVVLVSIVGTQITDLLTDTLEVSLYASTGVFTVVLGFLFAVWHRLEGTLSIESITTERREIFYWLAILCTFALGTAAGDLATEEMGLGFRFGVLVFSGLISITALAYKLKVNSVFTFWIVYILTRPLGAALGDFLTQARTYGGIGLGAMWTSVIFLSVIVTLVFIAQIKENKKTVSN